MNEKIKTREEIVKEIEDNHTGETKKFTKAYSFYENKDKYPDYYYLYLIDKYRKSKLALNIIIIIGKSTHPITQTEITRKVNSRADRVKYFLEQFILFKLIEKNKKNRYIIKK